MQLQLYEYQSDKERLDYEFYSEGPKGKIRKVVRFTYFELDGTSYCNLGFGDWNSEKQEIDDFTVTDNADAEKVLATVAAIALDFMTRFPGV